MKTQNTKDYLLLQRGNKSLLNGLKNFHIKLMIAGDIVREFFVMAYSKFKAVEDVMKNMKEGVEYDCSCMEI